MRRLWIIYNVTHCVFFALLAESPPMEIRLFHRFANGLYRLNNCAYYCECCIM